MNLLSKNRGRDYIIDSHHITPPGEDAMTSRRKIEERISRKQQEIQELELRLREAKAYIQALQDVVKMLPRDGDATRETSDASQGGEAMRPGSYVADARDAILAAGKALHIVDILKATGRENNRKNRTGMSGSLAAYVRRREVFTRPRPNTFGLIELNARNPQPSPANTAGPPDDFGLDEAVADETAH
jgi:hypothetical protein